MPLGEVHQTMLSACDPFLAGCVKLLLEQHFGVLGGRMAQVSLSIRKQVITSKQLTLSPEFLVTSLNVFEVD
jgi:hypothetical protein